MDKKTLRQCRQVVMARKELELSREEVLRCCVGATKVTDLPKAVGQGDVVWKTTDQRAKLQQEIDGQAEDFHNVELNVMRAIRPLPPLEFDIMYRRYILGQPWQKIAKELNYCRQHLGKIHKDILDKLC